MNDASLFIYPLSYQSHPIRMSTQSHSYLSEMILCCCSL